MTNPPGEGQQPEEPQQQQPEEPQGQPYPAQDQPYPPQEQPYPSQGYGQQPGQPYGAPYPSQGYGQQPGYPEAYQGGYAPDHPKATTSLILGILGIVICGVIAPFAWRMGKRTVDEIDASNGQLGGRGSAQAGYILGLIGTVLLALGLLFGLLLLGLGVIGAATSSTTY
jgi:hypothetical protein